MQNRHHVDQLNDFRSEIKRLEQEEARLESTCCNIPKIGWERSILPSSAVSPASA